MLRSWKVAPALLTVGVLALAGASDALAQACAGLPTAIGQSAVSGMIGFADGRTDFGAEYHNNLAGPLAVTAGYTYSSYDVADVSGHTFGGTVAYEIPDFELPACPVTGLKYTRISVGNVSGSQLLLPVGFGFGKAVATGSDFSFVPYAVPQLLLVRISGSGASDTSGEFGVQLGALLGQNQFFGRLNVLLSSMDDSDTVFAIGGGMLF